MRRHWFSGSVRVATWVIAVALVAPIVVAIAMSFTTSNSLRFPPKGFTTDWYRDVIDEPVWRKRVGVSLQVALYSAVLATTLGTLAAFGVARSRMRAAGLISLLFLLPLIVPIVILGTGTFFVWAQGWSVGPLHFGGGMVGSVAGLTLAHTVVAIPYPFITARASLTNVDPQLETAAKSLGAAPLTVFRTVTLPLIMPGVLAGLLFAFIASWDEVVIASFLSTSRLSTVPVQIFNQLRDALDPSAAAISTMLMMVSAMAVGLLAVVRRSTRGKR